MTSFIFYIILLLLLKVLAPQQAEGFIVFYAPQWQLKQTVLEGSLLQNGQLAPNKPATTTSSSKKV
jgi:hypothetical protein